MEVIIAHGSGGGLGILAFFPAGLLLLVGLVLILRPVVSESGRGVADETEDELDRVLGKEQARDVRRQARRRRAVRRRMLRADAAAEPGRPGDGDGTPP
jgi:hypothetical protein